MAFPALRKAGVSLAAFSKRLSLRVPVGTKAKRRGRLRQRKRRLPSANTCSGRPLVSFLEKVRRARGRPSIGSSMARARMPRLTI